MIEYKLLTTKDIDIYQSVVWNFRQQEVSEEKAIAFLTNPTNRVYVACDGRNAVGYILAYRMNRMDNGNDILNIFHLFVLKTHRRQGIARKLMTLVLDYAREEKLHYVFLITQNDNTASNALYLSCGGYNHPKDKEVYFWYITGRPATDDPDDKPLEQAS
ncbi:MAG: GNAT family N-acetyltransferase [Erysipelotrichaceae bacterium]|nr:GNAT family N-acetyltransferase [Erysipelotrichaceae bacterium]MDD3924618.1 GNAT family N-acetyltransferase [Erysipelotrichaceae bacterium]MDD4642681.1 GNAT family N-acetyltransferase [Erysipelotrichaceae bacterium]